MNKFLQNLEKWILGHPMVFLILKCGFGPKESIILMRAWNKVKHKVIKFTE